MNGVIGSYGSRDIKGTHIVELCYVLDPTLAVLSTDMLVLVTILKPTGKDTIDSYISRMIK